MEKVYHYLFYGMVIFFALAGIAILVNNVTRQRGLPMNIIVLVTLSACMIYLLVAILNPEKF
jgi:K+-transporting ATPase KdpF subunit